MAGIYSVTFRTAAAAVATYSAASAVYGCLFPASTGRVQLREVHVFNTTATACRFGLIRATARGTATTTQVGIAQDPADAAGLCNFDSGYSVNPTIGATTVLVRGLMVPASIGGGIILVFGPGEMILTSASGMAFINSSGTGQILDLNLVWQE